jgi:ribosomal protein S11
MVKCTYNNTSVHICTKLDDETVVAVTGTCRTEWNGKGGVESEHTV